MDELTAKALNIQYNKHDEKVICIAGFTKLNGIFTANVEIDKQCFSTNCYVMTPISIDEQLVIGLDILSQSQVIFNKNGISLIEGVSNGEASNGEASNGNNELEEIQKLIVFNIL